jgi:citrate lyase subunit beta/citryl-CoA lyase
MSRQPRRSLLYAPGDNRTKVENAARSAADGVIIDLESTVPTDAKTTARSNVKPFLEDLDFSGKETVVRINSLRSDYWLADLRAAIDAGVETIRLPKVEEPWEVITAVESAGQLTEPSPEFLLQLENPTGFDNGHEIAQTCKQYSQVTGIGIGIGDYTKTIGISDHNPDLRSYLLNQIAMFATVGELDPLGFVHKDIDDLREVVSQARSLGHTGQPISHNVESDEFIRILNEMYPERTKARK